MLSNKLEHIAFMMDGNGRWAKRRGLPRSAGHLAGMETMRGIIRDCHELQLKHVTFYAFSSENWKRPQEEVDYLLSLPLKFLNDSTINEFEQNNVKIKFIGDLTKLSSQLIDTTSFVEDRTKSNTGLVVNFAMNYGGRMEVVDAVKKIISDRINPHNVTQELFEIYLYTAGQPSPELIIRTSGEERLSNFLLWQSSVSELWFTKTNWPDFNKKLLLHAIEEYWARKLD